MVGIKPTYGRVSRYGLIAFASSLDQIGPLRDRRARRGPGARRSSRGATRARRDVPRCPGDGDFEAACGASVRGLRVGVPDEYFAEGLDAEVAESVRAAMRELEGEGCVVKPVKLPHTRFAVATYYVLATAEASSNLARFDGVRFGLRVAGAPARRLCPGALKTRRLRAMYGATRDAGFGAEVKRRILLGTFVLSAGYYDAYYLKAQKVRTLIRRDFDEAFREVDVICSPTAPTPPFRLGEKIDDPLAMYLGDIYTLPASLAGVPAMSVPCALTKAGLPVGLQVIAPPLEEGAMLRVAAAWEARSPVRDRAPAPTAAAP